MAMTLAEKIIARATARDMVTPGEIVTCQRGGRRIDNLTTNECYACDLLPAQLMDMIRDSVLVPHLARKLASEKGEVTPT